MKCGSKDAATHFVAGEPKTKTTIFADIPGQFRISVHFKVSL